MGGESFSHDEKNVILRCDANDVQLWTSQSHKTIPASCNALAMNDITERD